MSLPFVNLLPPEHICLDYLALLCQIMYSFIGHPYGILNNILLPSFTNMPPLKGFSWIKLVLLGMTYGYYFNLTK